MKQSQMQWKRWAIAAVAGVLLAAMFYVVGRWQERGRAEAAREEWIAQAASLEQEVARTRESLSAAETRIALLRARALLFEAALELERRNFGTANERLNAAAARLSALRGEAPGVDSAALEQLRQQIATTDLRVASNLAGQRARVLEFASQIASLLPQEGE